LAGYVEFEETITDLQSGKASGSNWNGRIVRENSPARENGSQCALDIFGRGWKETWTEIKQPLLIMPLPGQLRNPGLKSRCPIAIPDTDSDSDSDSE
jgi:hypothetical protein